jgi:hypothetical protein
MPNGAGGTVIYQKTVTVPDALDVLFIEFEGQGDVHNGSALLMNASIVTGTPLHPVETLCEPLRGSTDGGGGGPHLGGSRAFCRQLEARDATLFQAMPQKPPAVSKMR